MQVELMDLKKRIEAGTEQGRDILAEMASTVKVRIDKARDTLNMLSTEGDS
jgi:hypothetical protein